MATDTPEPRELPLDLENELAEILLRDPGRRAARVQELIDAHGGFADLLRQRVEQCTDETVAATLAADVHAAGRGEGDPRTPADTGRLPLELERAVLEAIEAEPAACAIAIERICARHPEHAPAIRRRLAAMESIREELSTELELSAAPAGLGGPIGPYQPVRLLGEGGMGRVYLATQESPVRRTVALKVMKPGLGGARLVERFNHERHTLARLSHSGVARIFDAGSTLDGQQYFAMECVDGEPLTDYCDAQRLGLEARLLLLCKVCDAVQHAHQKGVVHRDLKPGNILVTEEEGATRVVVIDFGLARIVESLEDGGARFTEEGVILGTPEYMSPEQADPGEDVDSRSDVYALGVILYELLVGRLPIDFSEARRQGARAMQKQIQTVESLPPSRRLLADPDRERLAALRGARQAARYARELGVDLDWVAARALAKDPDDRYQSVGALLADLQHYLASEPVQAGPPSTSYRIKKLLERHRRAFVAGLALLLSLTAGLIVSLVFYFEAGAARRAMEIERDAARREAKLSAAINTILEEDLLLSASPRHGDRDLKVRDALANAAERLDERLVDEPLVEASIRTTIGITFQNLGELESALPEFERAHDLYRQHSGADSEEALDVLAHIGAVQRGTGRADGARQTLGDAAERAQRRFGPDDALTLRLRSGLALVLIDLGQYPAAEEVLADVVRRARAHLPADSEELPSHINNLAVLYQKMRRLGEAGALFSEVIELLRARGLPTHPTTLGAMSSLGVVYDRQGRFAEAVAQHEEVLELHRRTLGEAHSDTLTSMNNLALALSDNREWDRAEKLLMELFTRLEAGGAPPQRLLASRNNLASVYRKAERWDRAEPLLRQVIEGFEALGMGEHPNADTSRASLALVLDELGRLDEAAILLEKAVLGRRGTLGTGDKRTATTMRRLARVHVRRGAATQAVDCYRKTLEWAASAFPAEDTFFDPVHLELAEALKTAGEVVAAESVLRARAEALRELGASRERLEPVLAATREMERSK